MIERYLDYLQCSVLKQEQDCYGMDVVPALRFYSRGYRDALGIRYYFGNPNPKAKKALMVAGGEALHNLRASGKPDYRIIGELLAKEAKFSRLDFAITEYIDSDAFVTLWDVKKWVYWELVESSLWSGGIKAISSIASNGIENIETLYIGDLKNRGRAGVFRAYDKGLEWGLIGDVITRIELEQRGDNAQKDAERFAVSQDLGGVFRSRFNVYAANFERLIESEAIPTHRGKTKKNQEKEAEMDKRWQWLMNQVAPALKDAIDYDEKSGRGRARAFNFAVAAGLKWKEKFSTLDED